MSSPGSRRRPRPASPITTSIGISYYRKWSTRSIAELGETIARVKARFGKDVIVVETAYPFTNDGADAAANLLGPDTLIPGYPATPEGQRAI